MLAGAFLGAPSTAAAQGYCGLGGAPACEPGTVCEPISSTAGLCCPDDPNTGALPYCIGPEGPEPATVLASDVLDLLRMAQDPALAADLFTGPWTNWYRDGRERGLAKLALMRGILERFNLTDTYVGSGVPLVTDPARPDPSCPTGPYVTRSLDGTCNDPANPLMGAAGTRFGRNILLTAAYPDESRMLTPNPREISLELLRRRGIGGSQMHEVPFLNNLATAWVQFQIHDWFDHGSTRPTPGAGTIEVPLSRTDPLRLLGMRTMSIPRTAPDPTRVAGRDDALPPTYTNHVTHWWDGSQIYGSDAATADRLRSHVGGRLRVDRRGLLPLGQRGYSDTGMRENFWVGLELLHTLFALEHNAIADMLASNHPDWDDQRLFDTARLINAALIAKIHTIEWTPAILPNSSLEIAMRTNWSGLNSATCPPLPQIPGLYPNPVVYGVVGNPGARNLHDAAYAMTEEFVAVYRMHPLLPERLTVRSARTGAVRAVVPTALAREAGGRAMVAAHGMRDLLYSFGTTHPGALVLDNYPQFMQDILIPGRGVIDMGTVDIVRDRERGIPRYNAARQLLRLPPVPDFITLTGGDRALAARLQSIYGHIDDVDLMVGTFAEGQRPSCYGFGETLFQVFTLMATRRLQADRFFTELYNSDVYTSEGLMWIELSSMKSVLLRHFPELRQTGLAQVANAFYPWE